MKNYLSAHHVSKRFRRNRVLDDVSFELEAPGVTVLLGPNGAGKSTLLSCVLGLLKPEQGELRLLGDLHPLRNRKQVCQRVGYVPDTPDAPEWMTPAELLRFLEPQYPTWNAELAAGMAERLKVPMNRRLEQLSRGEGAKAMLVAAFAHEPELLLFDEPFGGLDPVVRNDLLRGFLEEFRSDDAAALVATHDLEIAARIADRVIVLGDGCVQASGSVDEVLGEERPGRLPERMYELLEKVA